MVLLYHGTSLIVARLIAKSRAILSPFEKEVEKQRELYRKEGSFEKRHPNETIEEVAFFIARAGYNDEEIETRVMRFSMTNKLGLAKSYAERYEDIEGGIVLGLRINQQELESLDKIEGSNGIFFIKGRLDLQRLIEIHPTIQATGLHKRFILKTFREYSPRYYWA